MLVSLKEWRESYNLVHSLGMQLKDTLPSIDENGIVQESKICLSFLEKKMLEKRIEELLLRSSIWLDVNSIKPKKPLWKFSKKNPQTWASHKDFKFKHLLK